MSDQPRPVWITEADLATPLDSAFREVVRAKFNAAPTDATEAARDAVLKAAGGGLPLTLAYSGADAVLRALGMPDR